MQRLLTGITLILMVSTLSACAGFDKGNGLSRLDTETAEEKAEQKWFDKYYGQENKECDDSYWNTKTFCTTE